MVLSIMLSARPQLWRGHSNGALTVAYIAAYGGQNIAGAVLEDPPVFSAGGKAGKRASLILIPIGLCMIGTAQIKRSVGKVTICSIATGESFSWQTRCQKSRTTRKSGI